MATADPAPLSGTCRRGSGWAVPTYAPGMAKTQPSRPGRPAQLIVALVLAALAALFYGMTYTHLLPGESGLPSVALLAVILAIRFDWARWAAAVLLVLLTVLWLPPAIGALSEQDYRVEPVSYVLIGSALTITGVVLLFTTPSSDFYARAQAWRRDMRARGWGRSAPPPPAGVSADRSARPRGRADRGRR